MSRAGSAVVVGSGPNGLAAAIRLAQAGLDVTVLEGAEHVGGALSSAALTLPGFTHDLCSAVHPLAVASPFFRTLHLERFGLEWIFSPAAAAHPLHEEAILLYPSVAATAEALGKDGSAYLRAFGGLARNWERLFPEILRPPLQVPRHPLLLARFGAQALLPARNFMRLAFRTERAHALYAGIAAHANAPLEHAGTNAIGMMLLLAAHARGWPIPKRGAQSVATALVRCLESLGGRIETGRPVRSLADLPLAHVTVLDMMPGKVAALLGDRLGPSGRAQFSAYRHGHGVFKIDWALSAPIPWRAPETARSATVHLGGSLEEIAAAERCPSRGEHSSAPYVLLSQPTLYDPGRAPAGRHIGWAYCHVPAGSTVDQTAAIEAQVERFAPGFRQTILARSTQNCSALEARNPNLVQGDISGGAFSLERLLFRPGFRADPYRLPAPGFFLCSSATPPGPGVHGMAGFHAAESALRYLRSHRRP